MKYPSLRIVDQINGVLGEWFGGYFASMLRNDGNVGAPFFLPNAAFCNPPPGKTPCEKSARKVRLYIHLREELDLIAIRPQNLLPSVLPATLAPI